MVIRRSKFFKVNKIARGVSAICSLSEICKCSLHQIAREIMLLLVNNVHKKHQRVKTVEILKRARAICNFHSCNKRMHLFSTNKDVRFSARRKV